MKGESSSRRNPETSRQVVANTSASLFTFIFVFTFISFFLFGCPLPSLTVEGKRCRSGECPAPYECLGISAAGEGVCGRADVLDGGDGGGTGCEQDWSAAVRLRLAGAADGGELCLAPVDGGYLALYVGTESVGGPNRALLQRFDSAFAAQGGPAALSPPTSPVSRLALASRGSTLVAGWKEGGALFIRGLDENLEVRFATRIFFYSQATISTPLRLAVSADQSVVMAAWGETRDAGAYVVGATIDEGDGGLLAHEILKVWSIADLDLAPTGSSQFVLGTVRAGTHAAFLMCSADLRNLPPQREFFSDGGVGLLRLARREGVRRGASDVSAVWTTSRPAAPNDLQPIMFVTHEPLLAIEPQVIPLPMPSAPSSISSLQAAGISSAETYISWATSVSAAGLESSTIQGAIASVGGAVSNSRQVWAGEGMAISQLLTKEDRSAVTIVVSTPDGVEAANVCTK